MTELTVPTADGPKPAKVCTKCERLLRLDKCFSPDKRMKDGHRSHCRQCNTGKPKGVNPIGVAGYRRDSSYGINEF
jgi:hypothetical protein